MLVVSFLFMFVCLFVGFVFLGFVFVLFRLFVLLVCFCLFVCFFKTFFLFFIFYFFWGEEGCHQLTSNNISFEVMSVVLFLTDQAEMILLFKNEYTARVAVRFVNKFSCLAYDWCVKVEWKVTRGMLLDVSVSPSQKCQKIQQTSNFS
jgi:hypothetical protein